MKQYNNNNKYKQFMNNIFILIVTITIIQINTNSNNIFTNARLLQKANTFKDKFIKAFNGGYCINLASGTVHAGTNIQVYDCHKGEENYFSYTEAGEFRPFKAPKMCFEVSPDAESKHNVYLGSCNADSANQKWDFLSNGLVMSRMKFEDQPKGTCLQVEKKGAASNVDGGNCDGTSIFQQFTVEGFTPTMSMPKSAAPVAAAAAVTTTATKTIATEKKSESNIDLQQRLNDREGYHKLKTGGGCFCKTSWAVGASLFEYPNNCGDPDGLRGFSWCLTEEKPSCKGIDGHHHFDRCTPITKDKKPAGVIKTKKGCECLQHWEFNNRIFSYPNNCGDPDNIMEGKSWCYVDPHKCKGEQGKAWDFCTPILQKAKAPPAQAPAVVTTPTAPAAPATTPKKAAAVAAVLTKTISGCECKHWAEQHSHWYPEDNNHCGHERGQGKWCFVKDRMCEGDREFGFCEEDKIGEKEQQRLAKRRTDKAVSAATAAVVPGKTLKGCECDLWTSHKGYTDIGAQCGHDIGNGKWCFVKDKNCEGGAVYGFCEQPIKQPVPKTEMKPQAAGFVPANPDCGHGKLSKDKTTCQCRSGFAGAKCDQCAKGHNMDYPVCSPLKNCKCQNNGVCDKTSGKCSCSVNFAGDQCEKCAPGFTGSTCMPSGANAGTVASSLRQDSNAMGSQPMHSQPIAKGSTVNGVAKTDALTAKIVDDKSLQPHHHMLLSVFEIIALCMCCGCICRGGTCLRLMQKFRGEDKKLPSL